MIVYEAELKSIIIENKKNYAIYGEPMETSQLTIRIDVNGLVVRSRKNQPFERYVNSYAIELTYDKEEKVFTNFAKTLTFKQEPNGGTKFFSMEELFLLTDIKHQIYDKIDYFTDYIKAPVTSEVEKLITALKKINLEYAIDKALKEKDVTLLSYISDNWDTINDEIKRVF